MFMYEEGTNVPLCFGFQGSINFPDVIMNLLSCQVISSWMISGLITLYFYSEHFNSSQKQLEKVIVSTDTDHHSGFCMVCVSGDLSVQTVIGSLANYSKANMKFPRGRGKDTVPPATSSRSPLCSRG